VQRRGLDLLAAERRNWTITEITTAIHGESHTDSHRREWQMLLRSPS
jgi:hypothetical protein